MSTADLILPIPPPPPPPPTSVPSSSSATSFVTLPEGAVSFAFISPDGGEVKEIPGMGTVVEANLQDGTVTR